MCACFFLVFVSSVDSHALFAVSQSILKGFGVLKNIQGFWNIKEYNILKGFGVLKNILV